MIKGDYEQTRPIHRTRKYILPRFGRQNQVPKQLSITQHFSSSRLIRSENYDKKLSRITQRTILDA